LTVVVASRLKFCAKTECPNKSNSIVKYFFIINLKIVGKYNQLRSAV